MDSQDGAKPKVLCSCPERPKYIPYASKIAYALDSYLLEKGKGAKFVVLDRDTYIKELSCPEHYETSINFVPIVFQDEIVVIK